MHGRAIGLEIERVVEYALSVGPDGPTDRVLLADSLKNLIARKALLRQPHNGTITAGTFGTGAVPRRIRGAGIRLER
jgi:hypothetical protein